MTSPVPFDDFARLVRDRRTSMVVDQSRDGRSRRSSRELCGLATWAPNHKKTWPWRFALFTGAGRARLGATMVDDMIGGVVRRRRQAGQDRHEVHPDAGGARGRRRCARQRRCSIPRTATRSPPASRTCCSGRPRSGSPAFWSTPALTQPPTVSRTVRIRADRSDRRGDLPRLGRRHDADAGSAAGRRSTTSTTDIGRPDARPFSRSSTTVGETEVGDRHAPDDDHARPRGRARPRDLDRRRRAHRDRRTPPNHPRRARLRRPDEVPARPARPSTA